MWQSKICRVTGTATAAASCTIQELIGLDAHVSSQRFVVGVKLQELKITSEDNG